MTDPMITEHFAGDHESDLVVDCPICRDEAAELGMIDLLPVQS